MSALWWVRLRVLGGEEGCAREEIGVFVEMEVGRSR